MNYLQNLENALEIQIKNGQLFSESLSALLSHASSQVEQYPSLLIRRAASTLAILNSISEECVEIKRILSPNSLLDKEYQLKTAFTSQPKLPSSVFHREPQTDSSETTLPPLVIWNSGLPINDIGANISLPSRSLLKKKTGQVLEPGHGITSEKSAESAISLTTEEPIDKLPTKSATKKPTTSSKQVSRTSTGTTSKKTQTTSKAPSNQHVQPESAKSKSTRRGKYQERGDFSGFYPRYQRIGRRGLYLSQLFHMVVSLGRFGAPFLCYTVYSADTSACHRSMK